MGSLIINAHIEIQQNRITLPKATDSWRTIFLGGVTAACGPQDHSDFTPLPFLWLCLVCLGHSRFGEDLGAGDSAVVSDPYRIPFRKET